MNIKKKIKKMNMKKKKKKRINEMVLISAIQSTTDLK